MADDIAIEKTLQILDSHEGPITSKQLSEKLDVDHQRAIGLIKSIVSQAAATTDSFLNVDTKEYRKLELTPEGSIVYANGSHEYRIFQHAIKETSGVTMTELMECIPNALMAKAGFSKAMTNGWIRMDKQTKIVRPCHENVSDSVHDTIKLIYSDPMLKDNSLSDETIKELKKRKLITEKLVKFLVISKGKDFSTNIEKPETDITTALLQSGDWKEKKFKDYNFNALGVPPERGHLHPLLKVREQFRQIFLEMGFAEMPTNNFIESSFWNFDALFVPQAHPARDSQDTFFLSKPEYCHTIDDRDLLERVRLSHQGSETGAWPKGYKYKWSESECFRNVLRTHTTAVTARMLYKLANEHEESKKEHFKPAKFFSIDRVFRNETLDATHLAEFNQVEGVVVDENLTLGDLMGVLEAFFKKLGIERLRFKPAYNPYTEPSMEIFSYHPGLGKWVEVGNSGIFRPEMLGALGLPDNVTAIAWGLSLERPTMIKYKIDNIRDMVGHKVDMRMVQESPLCLF